MRHSRSLDQLLKGPLEVMLLRLFHDFGHKELGKIDAKEVVGKLLGTDLSSEIACLFIELAEGLDVVVEFEQIQLDLAFDLTFDIVILDKEVDIGAAAFDVGGAVLRPLEPAFSKIFKAEKRIFDLAVGGEDVAVELDVGPVEDLHLEGL